MAWPQDINPNIIAFFQPMVVRDGFLDKDPIVYPTVADDINVRSSDSFDGRYRGATGEIHGQGTPVRQDTYIFSHGNPGRQFNVIHGTWANDFQTDYSGVFGIVQQDNTKDLAYEIISADTTNGIENCTMYIGRGALPNVPPSYNFNAFNTYLYIYLAWGSKVDFRIALEYRRPMRLDRTQDGWATSEPCSVARNCGDTERFFANSKHHIPIDVYVDRNNNQIIVEFDNGNELHMEPYNPPLAGIIGDPKVLPSVGRIRLSGANGWCSFEYYPKRYGALNAMIRKDIGDDSHPRAAEAKVVVNSRAPADPLQKVDALITPNMTNAQIQEVVLKIQQPDFGDGSGAVDPPKLVDATMIIPPVWVQGLTDGTGTVYPNVISLQYWQEFDDNTFTFRSGGTLTLDNFNGYASGIRGNVAVDIVGSAGDAYYPIITGIAGAGSGINLFTVDTLGRITCNISDFSEKMMHPIGQRLILDRMCLYNAIQLVATLGGIHPKYLQKIPQYTPPGCDPEAPYGPAGIDCPYPVLSSGSGTHARHEYGPEMHGWDILQLLIQDQGKTNFLGTASVPLYTGFDSDGQLRAEAFDPSTYIPSVFFNEYDPSGLAQIQDINMNWNTEQMRSQVDFLGLNPWTNALEHYHVDQPLAVKAAIGYPSRWIERGARYSGDYLVSAANNAANMSAIPQLSGTVHNTWIPYVNAGQRCLVYDTKTLGFILDAYIKRVDATIGLADLSGKSGTRVCNAMYAIRSIANTPTIGLQ